MNKVLKSKVLFVLGLFVPKVIRVSQILKSQAEHHEG